MPEFTIDQINERVKADPEMTALLERDPTEFKSQVNNLYHSFGYRPDGSELPAAQKAFGKVSRATGIPEGVVQGVAATPIPLATTLLGAATKNPALTSAASVFGEKLNSVLGITDEMTKGDIALAAAAPLAGPALSRLKTGLSYGSRFLPGGGAAMHELASEAFAKQIQHLTISRETVQAMRDTLRKVDDFKVKVPQLQALFKNELDDVAHRAQFGFDDAYLKQINKTVKALKGANGEVSFRTVMSLEQGFNNLKEAQPHALWAKASGVIIDDLEAATKNPALSQATRDKATKGLQAFKNVLAVGRQYRANDSLERIFNRVVTPVPGDET